MAWNFPINIANAQAALQQLGKHYDDLYDKMVGKMGTNIAKWNIWEKMLNYAIDATKSLISESRELIAISTKYDIPIKRMGEFQMMAQVAGQSLGQVARNFRFLEMNFSRALLKPGGPQAQALHELGLNQEQITKAAGDTAYAMDIMKAKVMAIGDEERRNYFLQTMYGANWQNMLPILEMSVEQQQEMADAGHRYSQSITTALALVEKNMAEVAQDVKGPLTPIAVLFSFLSTALVWIIQGLSAVAQILVVGIVTALKHAVGLIREFMGSLARIGGKGLKFIGLEVAGNELESSGAGEMAAGQRVQRNASKSFEKNWNGMESQFRNMDNAGRRLVTQGNALAEGLGFADEGDHLKRVAQEMEDVKKEITETTQRTNALRGRLQEISKMSPEMREAAKLEKERIFKELEENAETSSELHDKLRDLGKQYTTSGGKLGVAKQGEGTKPRTAEEVKREQDLLASMQKYQSQYGFVSRAPQAEIETEVAAAKAAEHMVQLQREIAKLKEDGAWSEQAALEYSKKIMDGQISLMEKEKAHSVFLHERSVKMAEDKRDRTEQTIAMMEEREQTYMTRRGMTGMDKQAVLVENAIEKMVRDQEQLQRVLADPMKKQSEKDAARKQVDASAIKAQKEYDKYSMMQFQYAASDAAKKGMGGGIDIRESQLTVSKSQLKVLEEQLNLMKSQYGIDSSKYGDTPFSMFGPMRAGK